MTSIVITFMLFILVTLDQPWLPAESITLNQKVTTDQTTMPKKLMSKQPVGFVIGEENGQLEILIDDNRNIIFVPSADVVSHKICNLNTNPMGSSPVLELLSGETFSGHVLSCWRETDQLDETQKKNAPLPIRLLEWCPKQYPHPKNHKRPCL